MSNPMSLWDHGGLFSIEVQKVKNIDPTFGRKGETNGKA